MSDETKGAVAGPPRQGGFAVPDDDRPLDFDGVVESVRRLRAELERSLEQYGDHGLGEYASHWLEVLLARVDAEEGKR